MNCNVIMRISLIIALAIVLTPIKAGWTNKFGFFANSIRHSAFRHSAFNRKRLALGATGTIFATLAASQAQKTHDKKPSWTKHIYEPRLGARLYIGNQGGPGSRGLSYWQHSPEGWHRKFEPRFGEGATFLDCLRERIKCAWYTNPSQEFGPDVIKFAEHWGPGLVVEYDANKCSYDPVEPKPASSIPFIKEDNNGNTKSHSMLCTGMRGGKANRYYFVDGQHEIQHFNRCPNCYHKGKIS